MTKWNVVAEHWKDDENGEEMSTPHHYPSDHDVLPLLVFLDLAFLFFIRMKICICTIQ